METQIKQLIIDALMIEDTDADDPRIMCGEKRMANVDSAWWAW